MPYALHHHAQCNKPRRVISSPQRDKMLTFMGVQTEHILDKLGLAVLVPMLAFSQLSPITIRYSLQAKVNIHMRL